MREDQRDSGSIRTEQKFTHSLESDVTSEHVPRQQVFDGGARARAQ